VAGEGTVTIIDGLNVTHSNVSESRPGQPLALSDVKLHILSRNYGFSLKQRVVRMPQTKEDNVKK